MTTATITCIYRPAAPSASRFFTPAIRAKVRRAFELLAMPYMVEGSRYL